MGVVEKGLADGEGGEGGGGGEGGSNGVVMAGLVKEGLEVDTLWRVGGKNRDMYEGEGEGGEAVWKFIFCGVQQNDCPEVSCSL